MPSVEITSVAQWHALRRSCVATASTVAALIAPHPFESPLSIYSRAIGEIDPVAETDAMACGTDAELMMPARVKRVRPDLDLRKMNLFYRHPKLRFGGTPDFTDQYGGNWQGKCVDPSVFYDHWQGEPPLYVLIQHQAEYLLTGRQTGGVICLVRDRLFSTMLHEVDAHEGTMRALERAVAEMEERIAERDPPPADFHADADLLAHLHRHAIRHKMIDMTGDNYLSDLVVRYTRAKAALETDEAEVNALRGEIMSKIGNPSKVLIRGYVISAPEIADGADKTITAADVGKVIKGRAGHRRLQITNRTE